MTFAAYPFKVGERVLVKIDGERLVIEEANGDKWKMANMMPRIKTRIYLPLIFLLFLVLVGPARAGSTSRNWAGYFINANGVTAISAHWVVPEIECTGLTSSHPVSAAVSVWIGFDGLTKIPEQVGTDSICLNGSPVYTGWEEDPTLASPGAQLAFREYISAGDQITASITYQGNNRFQLTIEDLTAGYSRTFDVIFSNMPRASAEWIVEDPWYTVTNNYLTLPRFQPIAFSDCSAAVNGAAGSIVQNKGTALSMTDSNGNIIVQPQNLNQAGTSFTVAEVTQPIPETPYTPTLLLSTLMVTLLVLRAAKRAQLR